MKAAALRHLLLDRARHAIATGGDGQRALLESIVDSLSVSRDSACFHLRWTDSGGERTLKVPISTFSFYVAGDTSAAVARRPATLNLREVNWQAAAEVLRCMVAVSGGSFSAGGETYSHLSPLSLPRDVPASSYSIVLTVLSAATISWLVDVAAGIWVFVATAFSLFLFHRTIKGRGLPAPRLLEETIVTAFVAVSPFLGHPMMLALVLLAVAAACVAEISRGRPWSWFLAGLVAAPALAMGTPGVAAISVLALTGFASCWMMPDRFGWAGVYLYALGALLGFVAPLDWFAAQGETSGTLVLAPALLLAFSFALWWFHGVQRQVYPWYAQLSLATVSGAAFGSPGWSALAGLTGLGLVLSTRVVRSFQQSHRYATNTTVATPTPVVAPHKRGRASLASRLFNEGDFGPHALVRAAIIGGGFLITRLFHYGRLFDHQWGRRLYYGIYAAGKSISDASKIKLIRRILRPGDMCIDVGGAFGFFTRIAAASVGPQGRVLVLEPDPVGACFIQDLTEESAFRNVELKQVAAWDENTELTLNLCVENCGENSLFASPIHKLSITVPGVPIDSLCCPDAPISFIRMDIQGAEVRALKGMKRLLAGRDRLAMLIECSPDDLKLGGTSAQELVSLLLESGLTVYRLDHGPMKRLRSAEDLLDLSSTPFSQCDLLAVKGSV